MDKRIAIGRYGSYIREKFDINEGATKLADLNGKMIKLVSRPSVNDILNYYL